jgi:hypothetical protein
MSFIEEITPYIERIKLHQKGGNITNIETLRAIRDIHFKYIRFKDFDTPSNLGCGNCVRQMINQLVGEIGRATVKLERPIEDVSYVEVMDNQIEAPKHMTFPKQEPKKVLLFDDSPDYREFLGAMKWGEFKKHCTSKGLKVKGKTREVLENELKGL